MQAKDEALARVMSAARAGDARAYRSLLDLLTQHLKPQIRRLLSRAGGQAGTSELEDILQETLIAVHTRLHTFDPAYPVLVWVNAIARYKVIDHYRRVGDARRRIPIEEVEASLADPADPEDATLAGRDVARLLALLPDNLRRPIEDVKLKGLTVAESAARSGMSEAAVKVGIHRGMKRLIARMGGALTTALAG